MTPMTRFVVLRASLVAALLLASSTANASMHYYRQMLTSDLMSGAADYSLELRADLDQAGNLAAVVSNTMTAGAGLGTGSVLDGSALSYVHSFGAVDAAARIASGHLSVLTASTSESGSSYVEITLDDSFWLDRSISFSVLGGQIDAVLFEGDGELLVSITAHGSAMDLMWSMFRVNYEMNDDPIVEASGSMAGEISTAIPEPGAATLFAAGMLVVGTAIRRR